MTFACHRDGSGGQQYRHYAEAVGRRGYGVEGAEVVVNSYGKWKRRS